jgi:hypothetical protein
MAPKNESILSSMKKLLGIVPEYEAFDDQILLYINTAFSVLHQLGVGPEEGFEIADKSTTWEKIVSAPRLNMIQTYVGMKVKLMFDPPASSFALDALNKQIADYEWRITSEVACYGQ